ncbi:hypothetical protein [Treponema sp.]|uniref:hypothetical protein n=1 Tax=Treponema sp. TaxID=166 RepID=UPI00298E8FB5|nr:hypothetical protein [Treponema sp.]MCQ2242193.1 hypothetical protein [Treponema sp.]
MKYSIKSIAILSVVILLSSAFIACSNGSGDSSSDAPNGGIGGGTNSNAPNETVKSTVRKLKLNISDATNLYIAKTTKDLTRGGNNSTENKLFKVTEDGYAQEITYTYEVTNVIEYDVPVYDAEGNKVDTKKETKTEVKTETASESFVPKSITVLNGNYILVSFISDQYLVNNITGDCYEWPSSVSIDALWSKRDTYSDSQGNIYIVGYSDQLKYGIYKLDVADINDIKMSLYSSRSDVSINAYAVDKHGNLEYYGRDSSNSEVYRIKKANGGYENIPSVNYYIMFFVGFDGNLYYQAMQPTFCVKRIEVSDDSVNFVDYPGSNGNAYAYAQKSGFLRVKNKKMILVINELNKSIGVVYDENTNQASFYSCNEIGMTSLKFGVCSDDYYYVIGVNNANKTVIQKVDPLTKEYSTLIEGYDVYKLGVTDDEIVTFNALRMSDGAIVIGTVDSEGKINIMDESLAEEVLVLTKIR